MKPRNRLLCVLVIGVVLLAACAAPAAPPPPPAAEPTATTEVKAPEPTATTAPEPTPVPEPTATEAAAAPAVVMGADNMIEPHPLFVDSSGACTKKVALSFMEHGDWLDPNVDQRYGMGLLIKRWQEGQPCVELKIEPVPPGDAPGLATAS